MLISANRVADKPYDPFNTGAMLKFGNVIREMREAKRWTQDDLARVAGLSRSLVQMVEKSDRPNISARSYTALARAFGMTADEMDAHIAGGKREKPSLSLPDPIMGEYVRAAANMPRGSKGAIATAAMVGFLSAPRHQRERLLTLVDHAAATGDWSEVLQMIQQADHLRITTVHPGDDGGSSIQVVGGGAAKTHPQQSESAEEQRLASPLSPRGRKRKAPESSPPSAKLGEQHRRPAGSH